MKNLDIEYWKKKYSDEIIQKDEAERKYDLVTEKSDCKAEIDNLSNEITECKQKMSNIAITSQSRGSTASSSTSSDVRADKESVQNIFWSKPESQSDKAVKRWE